MRKLKGCSNTANYVWKECFKCKSRIEFLHGKKGTRIIHGDAINITDVWVTIVNYMYFSKINSVSAYFPVQTVILTPMPIKITDATMNYPSFFFFV